MRDAIDRIFSFRDDWNTLHVDAYFSKTEKKNSVWIRVETVVLHFTAAEDILKRILT